jgi:response regulator RpfG family c-di-GMP phosphodiesterase
MTDELKGIKETGDPILIVDDEEIVLVALRDTLLREGYKVVASPHAVHALSVLKTQQFSVVISDHQMPMISGLDFLAQVKEAQPNATRILITAVLSLNTVIDAINKGEIYRFVVKPWLREELLVTVKNAVQRYDLIKSHERLFAETEAMNKSLHMLNAALEAEIAKAGGQNRRLDELASAHHTSFKQSVELCVAMMQTFYPALGIQARRASELCRLMAQALNLPPEERQSLEVSAWIHDIGLVGVPRGLIRRWEENPNGLSPEEKVIIRHHPVMGAELAQFAHHLRDVGPTIRAHHECYDGSGYPDGLKGESIPYLARILSVVLAYVESRGEIEDACNAVTRGAGWAHDPELVGVFMRTVPGVPPPGRQREVTLADLRPGMVLARGIYTASGILLMPDGQPLTPATIEKLVNHDRINPIGESLRVYC